LDMAPRCPECANELGSENDTVCLHCGFNLKTRAAARTKKVKDLTAGDHFLWLLPGILSAVGFFGCVGAIIWAVTTFVNFKADANTDQIVINMWYCLYLWVVLGSLFLGYKTIRFAIARLILHPKPPEEEL
jgi:hypothetical protein